MSKVMDGFCTQLNTEAFQIVKKANIIQLSTGKIQELVLTMTNRIKTGMMRSMFIPERMLPCPVSTCSFISTVCTSSSAIKLKIR